MAIRFLRADEVLEIHRDQIDRYGGSPGIRNYGLLESAVALPQASFGGAYLHGDIHEMAAAYLYSLVMNHPFVDGNKRTGAQTGYIFLALNRISLLAPEDDYEELVLAVAKGITGKAKVAMFFRRHSRRKRVLRPPTGSGPSKRPMP